MAESVSLAKLSDPTQVDRALVQAAINGRFGETDLAALLHHGHEQPPGPVHAAGEERSLAQGDRPPRSPRHDPHEHKPITLCHYWC